MTDLSKVICSARKAQEGLYPALLYGIWRMSGFGRLPEKPIDQTEDESTRVARQRARDYMAQYYEEEDNI